MAEEKKIDPIAGVETTGHEWDGIAELNNPLPRWWLWVFYACIAYSIGYMVVYPSIPLGDTYFSGTVGYSDRINVAKEIAAAKDAKKEYLDRIETSSLEAIRNDADLLSFSVVGGGAAFKENCVPCHGGGGVGGPGYPNLIDDDWLWGGDLEAIHETIVHGIRWDQDEDSRYSEMSAFGTDELLEPAQITEVTDYVLTLSGQEPTSAASAKAGATIFADNCASCHAVDGSGDREQGAPALNDQVWLYGSDFDSVRAQIHRPQHGVMPAWGGRLDEATIKMLTVYVHAQGGGE
ncbi:MULTISPECIES: cytochrome-c oxidase, cbb3-type subunit III [Curvivirga]|uniref:cytochrome-c oxidase, cbb3-type subunit III n=1 Tax=Curvivirga TaxID=2856846 RepID=UPI0012BBA117|nr:cytochrome-c oxidase, cbb3-type subunit III [Curvivirga aplysinae]MTI08694.1 cytochrome-c oxidase, cbb3-type subunit III [Curvivirga aplysinae]